MIPVEEATARILERFAPVGSEWITLDHADDRFLAAELEALRTQPPKAVSAMDGYAIRAQDTLSSRILEVIGEVRAGDFFDQPLEGGQAVRIFTGAPLPDNADAILIQENAVREANSIRFTEPVDTGRYVRPAGLDFQKGWVGLRAGTRLGPQALGLAATMGHYWLPVYRRPRIGLLATGDELARPGTTPADHQHISSNTTALAAMCRRWGAESIDLGIAKDTVDSLHEVTANLDTLDLLVTTGGASVGEYDLIRTAFESAELELDFWKIAMRPGKPLMFGNLRGTPLLGLPGNPVSASVCSIIFLRPIIAAMLAQPTGLPTKSGRLTNSLAPNDERQDYLRSFVTARNGELWVESAPRQDSSMYVTFAKADALIVRPPHDSEKNPGDTIVMVEIAEFL